MTPMVCPAGHSRSFTTYGLCYSCHDCSPIGEYKFVFRKGHPVWVQPELVPIGLRERANREDGRGK